MKHFFFCALAALATIGMISRAEAKDPEDAESDHVIVTLKSGEKVDCYVHRGWHAENSVFKKENYSFKVTKTPDGKEPIEYTADDVVSIDYIETTADHPDGLRWESHPLAKAATTRCRCSSASTKWERMLRHIGGKSGWHRDSTVWAARSRPTTASASTTTPKELSTHTCWLTRF